MCCADFNVASGLPGENSYSYIKTLTVFIHKQTSLFEESGVRKRTDPYKTLLHFFWVFRLNSGECAHKSFVQCFNQLCWVSRQRGERPKHQSMFCILQEKRMLLMGSGTHTCIRQQTLKTTL